MEVSDMFIHVYSLWSFSGLYEMVLGLLKPLFVFELEGKLQMDISDLMFGIRIGHLKGFIKLVPIREILDDCIDQIHLQEHLHPHFGAQSLCPSFRELTSVHICSIQL